MKAVVALLAVFVLFAFVDSANAQVEIKTGEFLVDYVKTPNYNLDKGEGQREQNVEVRFDTPFANTPTIILGTNKIDAEATTNLRYEIKTTFVTKEGFIVKVITWADSKIYQIGGSWVAIAPGQ